MNTETAATTKPAVKSKAKASTKKSGVTKKSTKSATPKSNGNGGTTLADICKGLKMEPRSARRYLRNSDIQVDGQRWTFTKAADIAKVKKLLSDAKAANAA